MNEVHLLLLPGDGCGWADLEAGAAARTFVGEDPVLDQGFADLGGTSPTLDMSQVLILEVFQRGEHRIGSGLSQAAERRILDRVGKVLEDLDVLHSASAVADVDRDHQHTLGADAAPAMMLPMVTGRRFFHTKPSKLRDSGAKPAGAVSYLPRAPMESDILR